MKRIFLMTLAVLATLVVASCSKENEPDTNYPLEGTESLQVSTAEVGDITEIWIGYLAESGYFPRVIGAHLHDGNVCFRC